MGDSAKKKTIRFESIHCKQETNTVTNIMLELVY